MSFTRNKSLVALNTSHCASEIRLSKAVSGPVHCTTPRTVQAAMFMGEAFLTTKVNYTLSSRESEDNLKYLSLLLNQEGSTGDFWF